MDNELKSSKYLDLEKIEVFIRNSDIKIISKIWIVTEEIIYYWGMMKLEDIFRLIETYICEIYTFVDIDCIVKRAYKIRDIKLKEYPDGDKFEIYRYLPLEFNSKVIIEDVIPEIIIINGRFKEAFMSSSPGIEKTEAWLYPYALKAGADADLEALIYFKSKGESLIPPDELSQIFRKAICFDVARDSFQNKKDKHILEKAQNNELSINELSDLFSKSNCFPNFLSARDEEEEFITATFFRTVEWFQLNEFEPWINAYAQEISTIYQGGIDERYSLFQLFYLCRSNLILRKASKFGLEALLHGICVGNIEASKPWKRYCKINENTNINDYIVDYIPTASIIAFAWQRINPANIKGDVYNQALLLLFQSQLLSGGWPLSSKDIDGSILSTCLAMIALGVSKPEGYERYLNKAREWLLSQQNEVGCWYIQGAPAIMINVLCIEAIKLSQGNGQVTYTIQNHMPDKDVTTKVSNRKQSDNYIVFCEGNSAGTKNRSFDEKCYTRIFSSEFPDTIFCSVGSCKDIESEENILFDVVQKISPFHTIIKLLDRDDRSLEEIEELRQRGITVLSLRELESYLLEDEIVKKLCKVCGKPDKIDEVLAIKSEALKNSILDRNNPIDDIKSAAGEFFTNTKKALGLIKCGNDTVSFLRDTMAPLITKETDTYKLLRKDIFGI